ncbi:Facilitated trehalose transporter Tret1 [Trichoplax sp. H2]|nr:Facilitated trehalose transporter Tret1 [Trichoplax sp. H2]|eukprot:RDD44731.1 Facilitated trehalose transporter Tret1 [Trichoplax sp. H2]
MSDTDRLVNKNIQGHDLSIHQNTCCRQSIWMIVTIILCTCLLEGYAVHYSAPVIPKLMEKDYSAQVQMSQSAIYLYSAIIFLGMAIGTIIASFFLDQIGRRTTMILSCVPHLFGWLFMVYGTNPSWLIGGRFMVGTAVGTTTTAATIYMLEVSPETSRRPLLHTLAVATMLGGAVCGGLSLVLHWRYLALIGASCSLINAIGISLQPQSPKWLILKGQPQIAAKALRQLHGQDVDVEIEIRKIEQEIEESERITWRRLRLQSLLRPFLALIAIISFVPLMGASILLLYSPLIYIKAGFDFSLKINLGICFARVLGALLAIPLINNFKRRIILIISGIGMCVGSFIFGLYFQTAASHMNIPGYQIDWLSVAGGALYSISVTFGWASVSWVLLPEILPKSLLRNLIPYLTAYSYTLFFIMSYIYIYMVNSVGSNGSFWIFSSICLIVAFTVYFILPETKDKSIEEVIESFQPTKRIAKTSTKG